MTRSPYVLIIDDEPDVRELFHEVLASQGYRVGTACHGEEGLQRLREPGAMPDVILLDLAMPRMDGLQFREAQQRCPAWASIPVVVVSASVSPKQARQLGVDAVLLKPLDPMELVATVERVRHRGAS